MRQIKLDAINTTSETQGRVCTLQSVVKQYAKDMEHGNTFPPVDVFTDGTTVWLSDGFHRYESHERLGRETIDATVHKGTLRDAILFAVNQNALHGLRRTPEDKRFCVGRLLEDATWKKRSDNWVAEQCHVGDDLVASMRAETTQTPTSCPGSGKIGKDGRKQTRIRKRKKAVPRKRCKPKVAKRVPPVDDPAGSGIELEQLQDAYDTYLRPQCEAACELVREQFKVWLIQQLSL